MYKSSDKHRGSGDKMIVSKPINLSPEKKCKQTERFYLQSIISMQGDYM